MRLGIWPATTLLPNTGNELIMWFEAMKAGLLLNGVTWPGDARRQADGSRTAQLSVQEACLNGHALQAAI
jgi:hypothetical protein